MSDSFMTFLWRLIVLSDLAVVIWLLIRILDTLEGRP